MRSKQKLTPPEVAAAWGLSPDKVLRWIATGELHAINVATRATGRPRWLIDEADLAAFEARRSVRPVTCPPKRRRQPCAGVTEFF